MYYVTLIKLMNLKLQCEKKRDKILNKRRKGQMHGINDNILYQDFGFILVCLKINDEVEDK